MKRYSSYIAGKWVDGDGEGRLLNSAIDASPLGTISTDGIDISQMYQYGREKGKGLASMSFYQRARMLKKLALALYKNKERYYEISYLTGATRSDSWIDIEGGIGNLFSNASLRRELPSTSQWAEGKSIPLSKNGKFMGHHMLVSKQGVAVHINAYNFPVWGMLEKCAVNWLAGMPAIVKPASVTSFLTHAVVEDIIASGILPEGSLQLLMGSARDILDYVNFQDVVTFTGSAETGRKLKTHPQIIAEAVPFNMEADSLNSITLGPDVTADSPEFKLFIKEIRKEMTIKCGQRCTSIRRILVPRNMMDGVREQLVAALSKVVIGDPREKENRMGALAGLGQLNEVEEKLAILRQTTENVMVQDIAFNGVNPSGAYMAPVLLQEMEPLKNTLVHEIEAFGPVSTMMPYDTLEEAIHLNSLGKGSLVCSVVTYDPTFEKAFVLGSAPYHGRILVINRDMAKENTGHGSALPTLIHGGPGRAGGGEEMGGLLGVKHYLNRVALQGSPKTISNITEIFQPGSKALVDGIHPFSLHFDEQQVGKGFKSAGRTVTESDIVQFANVSWDHFYAHTDVNTLRGTIFEERVAHGYFILSAAAGLFVHPPKGPVIANYGLDHCRFLQPVYAGDTIYVHLTCQEKIDRDDKKGELPSGVVKWLVEVFNQRKEQVAIANILTLVAKKSPFITIDADQVETSLSRLTENTKPAWGSFTPQQMVEHLEDALMISMGFHDYGLPDTPPEKLEGLVNWLYNHKPMLRDFKAPFLDENNLPPLRHASLEMAKEALLSMVEDFEGYLVEHPGAIHPNPVFGNLNMEQWELLHRKHFNHHFLQFGLL